MTRTSAPASCRRLTRSGALYAAIPPETPRTMFMIGRRGSRLLRGLQGRGLLDRRRELPLHLVLLDLLHGDASGLSVLALHLRMPALNQLLGALRDEQ